MYSQQKKSQCFTLTKQAQKYHNFHEYLFCVTGTYPDFNPTNDSEIVNKSHNNNNKL